VDSRSELPSAAEFAHIESQLFDRIANLHRRQVVRHRLVAAAAVLVVAGAGIAAGTVANPTQQSKFANCYEGDNTNSQLAQVAFPTNRGYVSKHETRPSAAQISNALFLCKSVWSGGGFSSGSDSGRFAVPALQVCLQDNLVVSIFRKTETGEGADAFCGRLGMSAP
jgi:hypothetical protein